MVVSLWRTTTKLLQLNLIPYKARLVLVVI